MPIAKLRDGKSNARCCTGYEGRIALFEDGVECHDPRVDRRWNGRDYGRIRDRAAMDDVGINALIRELRITSAE